MNVSDFSSLICLKLAIYDGALISTLRVNNSLIADIPFERTSFDLSLAFLAAIYGRPFRSYAINKLRIMNNPLSIEEYFKEEPSHWIGRP